jgi:hypothetical protein
MRILLYAYTTPIIQNTVRWMEAITESSIYYQFEVKLHW